MAANQDDTFEQGPVCRSGAKIVYAWAMDAPDLHLPPGTLHAKVFKICHIVR